MIRTLIVEDDFRVAEMHRAFVERLEGFEVVGAAHTAAEAMALVASTAPDLVLLDMYLPDRPGLDLLRELRADNWPPLDFVAITAARDVETLRAALQGGVVHYLVKPFQFSALREKLESYAALHARLTSRGELDQDEVDRIVGLSRAETHATLPKGLSPATLGIVAGALREAATDLAAGEVASRTGVSRVTARRYLERLAQQGLVSVAMRYGATGRPEHRYRWLATAETRKR